MAKKKDPNDWGSPEIPPEGLLACDLSFLQNFTIEKLMEPGPGDEALARLTAELGREPTSEEARAALSAVGITLPPRLPPNVLRFRRKKKK